MRYEGLWACIRYRLVPAQVYEVPWEPLLLSVRGHPLGNMEEVGAFNGNATCSRTATAKCSLCVACLCAGHCTACRCVILATYQLCVLLRPCVLNNIHCAPVGFGNELCTLKEYPFNEAALQVVDSDLHVLKQVSHPNLIRVDAVVFDTVRTRLFLQMPHYTLGTMHSWLQSGNPRSMVPLLAAQVLDALRYSTRAVCPEPRPCACVWRKFAKFAPRSPLPDERSELAWAVQTMTHADRFNCRELQTPG